MINRLKFHGLTAKPKKCALAMKEMPFLGYIVGGGQVRPTDEKIEAITNYVPPATKKEVRAFLGLAGYYSGLMPNFATVAAPLSDLTKKHASMEVKWNSAATEAFRMLKEYPCSAPVLLSSDLTKPFVLRTVACDRGIRGDLGQDDKSGIHHPILYISKKLQPREEKYATIEKECWAIVWCINKLKPYLYGRAFTVETDHHPLRWLDLMKDKNAKPYRWCVALQGYKLQVKHIPRKTNVSTDWLSRSVK